MTKTEFKVKYNIEPHDDILRGDRIATAALVECGKHTPVVTKYGIQPCQKCIDESIRVRKVSAYPEFVPDYIKKDREKNITDQLQSHRSGYLSREFVEAYPNRVKGMIKEGVITKKDVIKSKYVWKGDVPNWNGRIKKVDAEMI
jgi:hypothetical protein